MSEEATRSDEPAGGPGPTQFGFDLEGLAPVDAPGNQQQIREELNALLALAKAAREAAPWDRQTHRHHQRLFPQMASRLPPEEAEFLRRQFVLELERIERLLAA